MAGKNKWFHNLDESRDCFFNVSFINIVPVLLLHMFDIVKHHHSKTMIILQSKLIQEMIITNLLLMQNQEVKFRLPL